MYEPILGTMYDRTVTWIEDKTWDVDGPGDEGRLSLDGLMQPLIEPELLFHFREAPPVTDDPQRLLQSIDWIGHGFEIVQCHFPDWKFGVADTVADGGLHGRYVAGPGMWVEPNETGLVEKLESFRIRLYCNGKLAREGGGELVLGSPLNALAHAIRLVLCCVGDFVEIAHGRLPFAGTLWEFVLLSDT